MNTLSWFIYFVNIVEGMNAVLSFVLTILFIAGVVKLLGMTAIYERIEIEKYPYYRETKTGDRVTMSIRTMVILWFLIVGLDVLVPSRQTLILIAASEVGEKLVTNEKVGNFVDPSLDLLRTWIDKEKHDLMESMKTNVKESKK